MNDNPPKDIYPPDFIHPEMVEETGHHIAKLTFPDGFTCYAPSQDEAEWIYNEIMIKREYFQNGLSVAEARCVIDIGANIGIFTMAVKLMAPEASVYAFEPISETFLILEQNVRSLGCLDVNLFKVAVGSQDCSEQTLTFYIHMPGNSTAIPALKEEQRPALEQIFGKEALDFATQSETRRVQVRTLSSVIRERGITCIDFLKIDVEGSEISVLDGIDENHWPMIKQIAVETHSVKLQEQVCEILTRHKFKVYAETGISSPFGDSLVYGIHLH